MTIRANTDIRRHAEAHLATITPTRNFIVCHANYGRGCAVGRGLATGVALGVGVGVGLESCLRIDQLSWAWLSTLR